MTQTGARITAGCVFAMVFLCALPLYWFFGYCPVDSRLLTARRQIRVGMTVYEAKKRMPEGFSQKLDSNQNGFLRISSICSVQCMNYFMVTCEKGIVTKVDLQLYNDMDHSSREIK